jgi:L-ascorbate metabolism protein UlaG (beta-lactamase superfamily)
VVSDGKTSLLFDPFITRPSLWDFISLQKVKSDKKLIEKWLAKVDADKMVAILPSHTHYDHAMDLVEVQRQTGAKIYGSQSALNIAKGGKVASEKMQQVSFNQLLTIGAFKIRILEATHPPHLFNILFLAGKIEAPLESPAALYQYTVGESFSYMITHPDGTILYHPAGFATAIQSPLKKPKANIVIQGTANRKSTEDLIEKVLLPYQAEIVIPVHYDDMFSALKKGIVVRSRSDMQEFNRTMKSRLPKVKVLRPKYGEKVTYRF